MSVSIQDTLLHLIKLYIHWANPEGATRYRDKSHHLRIQQHTANWVLPSPMEVLINYLTTEAWKTGRRCNVLQTHQFATHPFKTIRETPLNTGSPNSPWQTDFTGPSVWIPKKTCYYWTSTPCCQRNQYSCADRQILYGCIPGHQSDFRQSVARRPAVET